eukprot:1319377-Rhodomonas_salina.1
MTQNQDVTMIMMTMTGADTSMAAQVVLVVCRGPARVGGGDQESDRGDPCAEKARPRPRLDTDRRRPTIEDACSPRMFVCSESVVCVSVRVRCRLTHAGTVMCARWAGFQAEMGDWFVAGPHMTSDRLSPPSCPAFERIHLGLITQFLCCCGPGVGFGAPDPRTRSGTCALDRALHRLLQLT